MLGFGLRTTKHVLDVAYAVGALASLAIALSGLSHARGNALAAARWLMAGGAVLAIVFCVVVVMTQFGHL